MPKALITGANSGIGKEIAKQLAALGYKLTLHIRNFQRTIDFLDPSQVAFDVIVADLAEPEQRALLLKKIDQENYDLIINNAGLGLYGRLDTHTFKEEKELIEVNVNSLFEITFRAIASFKTHKKKGTILNVSSAAAFVTPFPYFASYAASKAFVLNLSKSLDAELCPLGIRVLASCPGQIKTPFRIKASKFKSQESENAMSAEYAAKRIVTQIKKGKRTDVFNFSYKIALLLVKFLPSKLLEIILKSNIEKRIH